MDDDGVAGRRARSDHGLQIVAAAELDVSDDHEVAFEDGSRVPLGSMR